MCCIVLRMINSILKSMWGKESAVTSLATALKWRRRHKDVLTGSRTPCWQAGCVLSLTRRLRVVHDHTWSRQGDMRVVARGVSGHPVTLDCLGLQDAFIASAASDGMPLHTETRIFMSMQHQPSKSNRYSFDLVCAIVFSHSFLFGLELQHAHLKVSGSTKAPARLSTWLLCWSLHVGLARKEPGALTWCLWLQMPPQAAFVEMLLARRKVCDCRGFQISKNLDPRPAASAVEADSLLILTKGCPCWCFTLTRC